MKKIILLLNMLLSGFYSYAQAHEIKLMDGAHDEIVSMTANKERSILATIDKQGFITIWNTQDFSIINKFQKVPAGILNSTSIFTEKIALKLYGNKLLIHSDKPINYTPKENIIDVYDITTGKYLWQTKNGIVSHIAYLEDNTLIRSAIKTKASGQFNFFESGVLEIIAPDGQVKATANLHDMVSCIEVDEKKKKLFLGYKNGKVEVWDMENLRVIQKFDDYYPYRIEQKIDQIKYAPNSSMIAYSCTHSNKIVIRDYANTHMDTMALQPPKGDFYSLSFSPNGKFLAAKDGYSDIVVYNIADKSSKKLPSAFRSAMLGSLFFITDEILAGAGLAMDNTPYLGLLDWQNEIATPNYNISISAWASTFGIHLSKPSPSETILIKGDREFAYIHPTSLTVRCGENNSISGFSDYYEKHSLKQPDHFWATVPSRGWSNAAKDLHNPYVFATLFHNGSFNDRTNDFFIGYYNMRDDSFIAYTPLQLPGNEVYKSSRYRLEGTVLDKGLTLFSNNNETDASVRKLIVYDKQGKIVFEDDFVDHINGKRLTVNADVSCMAYQNSHNTLAVVSLKNFKKIAEIPVGFQKVNSYYVNGYASPTFIKSDPNYLIHEVYKEQAGNAAFCLVKTNIKTLHTDTVFQLQLLPMHYSVDEKGERLVLVYNTNFTDTAVWNQSNMLRLAEENFKSAYNPTVFIYNVSKKDITHILHPSDIEIVQAQISGSWLTVLTSDGQLAHIDLNNSATTLTQLFQKDGQAFTNGDVYYATKNMLPYISVKEGTQTYPASSKDILLNQPHTIIRQLDNNSPLYEPYSIAYNKRIGQPAVNKSKQIIKTDAAYFAPQTTFLSNTTVVNIPVAKDIAEAAKIHVYVNGYPLHGSKGVDMAQLLKEKNLALRLDPKDNIITIDIENKDGTFYPPLKYYYYNSSKDIEPRKLYLFAVGVSRYKDTVYNLKYAAKDIKDIAYLFKQQGYDSIIINTLYDENATIENIKNWADLYTHTNPNDIIVTYFAGHGLLDKHYDFCFAAHNTDFTRPASTGLPYTQLLDMINTSPSRHKVLFLDACHSGAFDREGYRADKPSGNGKNATIVSNELTRGAAVENVSTGLDQREAFVLMNQLFSDFSGDAGVEVIAASLGNSYALEKPDLQNGLFTYAFIRGVGLKMARPTDEKINSVQDALSTYTGIVEIKQLKKYLDKEVQQLSNGAQVPSIRGESVYGDDIGFFYKTFVFDPEFEAFLKRYE